MLDIHLVTHLYPYSSAAESYRHLRTGIEFARTDKPIRRILVSSPNRGDGKSVTAANLALAFAQADRNVLLVDADLRRPRLHTLFELPHDPGFADVLLHGKHAMEVIVSRVLPNLDVLPSGVTPRHPSEALGSRRMRQFLDDVDKVYDIILFDAPPLLPVNDAILLSPVVDAVILVACRRTDPDCCAEPLPGSAAADARSAARGGAQQVQCAQSVWRVSCGQQFRVFPARS